MPEPSASAQSANAGAEQAAVPRVPRGRRVYAIGDCHGCAELLRDLHRRILEDCEAAEGAGPAPERRVAVYLGDYVDRGPESRDLLDLLIEEPLGGFESIHLKGNHDDFMIRFLEGTGDLPLWLYNGGDATLRSYGLDLMALPREPASLRAAVAQRVPEEHRRFLGALRLSHVEGDYLFVHAGIRPGVPLEDQDPDDLLWIREPFLTSGADHGKVVVHGHTPTATPMVRPNRIGIDTGACYGGMLTALVLEDDGRRFLQV